MFRRIKKFFSKKIVEEKQEPKKDCVHDPDMFVKINEGTMHIPGIEGSKKTRIRMMVIQCTKCKKVFKMSPCGISRDENEPEEQHSKLSEADKLKLMKELEKENLL